MRKFLTHAPRFRVALAMIWMLALLPLASLWNVSQAKPPRHAPAYGYRKKQKKHRVYRRAERREYRRNRRDDRGDNRRYRTRYRTRINRDGNSYREYFRSYY